MVPDNFKITIALDTQILAYLLDKTYPDLNFFIKKLADSDFVDLVCSSFVTHELIGIRKTEHYLRSIHHVTSTKGGVMNFSSAIKFRRNWSAPEHDYKLAYPTIKTTVKSELQRIYNDYNINYYDILDKNLWAVHQDLVLSSKVSKEDSLVLLSSIYNGQPKFNEEHLIFLTNDHDFYQGLKGKRKISAVDTVFSSNNIRFPQILPIKAIKAPNSTSELDLVNGTNTNPQIQTFINSFLLENIKNQNEKAFLGNTSRCQPGNNFLCFDLEENKELSKGDYLTIIDKNLTGVHHTSSLKAFHAGGSAVTTYPYTRNHTIANSKKISIRLMNDDGTPLTSNITNTYIEQTGNLVFLHPDSSL